jgi:NAD(P)-dependent dehydrogenase (short-subunit alcohol dehydrogenase family)
MRNLGAAGLHQLDITSHASIAGFSQALASQPIDLLLNIAGKAHIATSNPIPHHSFHIYSMLKDPGLGIMPPKASDTLETVSLSTLTKTFETNTFGPLLLVQSLLPNLLSLEARNPTIANVSSRVGSIGDNSSGGAYAYRASKAALNAVSKSMAADLKERGVTVAILHPGIVKSGLDPAAGDLKEAVEPEVAVSGLWEVLKRIGLEDTGRFWNREGREIEW